MVRHFPATDRTFEAYGGFANTYDGSAAIARLLGPAAGTTLGCGIARYQAVRTVWHLPFDEVIYVVEGAMTVRAGADSWRVGVGDVLWFPRGQPIEYDVPEAVTVFYAIYPAKEGSAATDALGEAESPSAEGHDATIARPDSR